MALPSKMRPHSLTIHFGRHVVESDVTAPELYLLFLTRANKYNAHFNGTNRAQTNDTGFV